MAINYDIKETWLRNTNPSVKLILFIFLFVYVLFIHNPTILINLTLGAVLLLIFCTGHPWKYLLLFSLPFILLFVATSSSMIFFGKGETTWFKWGIVHITEESYYRGIHIGFRALFFAVLGLVFALTTRPVFMFYSLMQQLKLPAKYAYSFMAAVRLLPILIEEFQTLGYAYKVRGVHTQRGVRGFYQKLKFFSVPLLAQSIRRAQRIAVAMEAKRFSDVKNRSYFYHIGYSKFDLFLIVYFLLTIGLAFFLGNNIPYFDIIDVRHYE